MYPRKAKGMAGRNSVIAGCVYGTGGGARKYAEKIKELLDTAVVTTDELKSLIMGISFMLRHSPNALFTVDHTTYPTDGIRFAPSLASSTTVDSPYLLVNIGSGVSIMRVAPDGSHVRVGGTSIGGSTVLGLVCMITGCSTFAEALALADAGDARKIDLLVSDIYGGDYNEYNLSADTVASSLGKLSLPEVRANADPRDLARAILDAVTNNIGSLAMLHATAISASRIIFAGNFLRGNKISVARLSYATEFWSKGVHTFSSSSPRFLNFGGGTGLREVF